MGKEDTDMTIEDLEKYCVRECIKSREKANEVPSQSIKNYYHGKADAFLWITSVIQQNKPRETPH